MNDSSSSRSSPISGKKRQRTHPWQRRKIQVSLDDEKVLPFGEKTTPNLCDHLTSTKPFSRTVITTHKDAYQTGEIPWQELLIPSSSHRFARPFPSSQVLASTIGNGTSTVAEKKLSPFLKRFYESLGVEQEEEIDDKEQDDSNADKDPTSTNALDKDTTTIPDLDNPAFSTISAAQHRRYLKLHGHHHHHHPSQQHTDRRTPSERNFLKHLRPTLQAEQTAYLAAVEQFWSPPPQQQQQQYRLLSGFSNGPSHLRAICQWASTWHKQYNQFVSSQLLRLDNALLHQFGKCRQVLSLQYTTAITAMSINHQKRLDMQSLDFVAVHTDPPPNFNTKSDGHHKDHDNDNFVHLDTVGDTIYTPPPPNTFDAENKDAQPPPYRFLKDDNKALELARKHRADILTTDEMMETLLMIPGVYSTRWMILATTTMTQQDPLKTDSNPIVVLDPKVEQMYATPRECLTRGLEESLYYQLWKDATNNNTQQHQQQKQSNLQQALQYAYTLWTLPMSRQGRPIRVLIRCRRWYLVDASTRLPLKLRVHVEYFPERGREMLSKYERSLWILDQLLWQHQVTTKVARVDAKDGRILEWQDASVAHAFAEQGQETEYLVRTNTMNTNQMTTTTDVLQGFGHVMQLLYALPTIDFSSLQTKSKTTTNTTTTTSNQAGTMKPSPTTSSWRLLCFPSREVTIGDPNQYSVSVHAPWTVEDDAMMVDLKPIMEQADGVMMHSEALRQCQHLWMWKDDDRIPFTFPYPKGKS